MASRHIIDWNKKHKNITTNLDNKNWLILKSKYASKSLTRYNLILHALQGTDYNQSARSLNRLIRNNKLSVPVGDIFVTNNRLPVLRVFLECLQLVSKTHTAYAFFCVRLLCEFCKIPYTKLVNLRIKEYNKGIVENLDITLPKWAQIVLERQKQIALSIGMEDDDPLFFVMRWTDMKKTSLQARAIRNNDPEVTDTLYKFRMKFGYSISEYIESFVEFCGLKRNAIVQKSISEYTGTKFVSDKSIYGRLVAVYEYDFSTRRKTVYDFGYVVWAKNGLYLVHCVKGLLWCPYYLLGEPTVRPGRDKDNQLKTGLHQLGYYPIEFYDDIKDHKTLRTHTIQRRKFDINASS